jgi:hypothetical protein
MTRESLPASRRAQTPPERVERDAAADDHEPSRLVPRQGNRLRIERNSGHIDAPPCYDNSIIESFWSRMQVELLDRKEWNTRLELANAMFEYLEIWHNRKRRHSQLGWLTPIEFERNRIIPVA